MDSYRTAYTLLAASNPVEVIDMMRKNKADTKTDTGLARPTTGAPPAWFDDDDMDRWFDDIRRSFEQHFWGPLARGSDSEHAVRQPFVDLIENGSEFVVRA